MTARLRLLAARALDLVLPPRCPGCGVIVEAQGRFCAGCWGALAFLGPPWCARCNLPFVHDRGAGACCAPCLDAPPRHAGVRAAVAYGPVARRLALGLKYGGRGGHARIAAQLMRRLVPGDTALFVPVPLHRRRLWSRGYNQAGWIVAALSRLTGVPGDMRVLVRRRATPVLRGMGPRERHRAVAGAFAVDPARRAAIAGRHVVLVDDVHTSCATAGACTDALLAAGAERVTILAWSRVVGSADASIDPSH